MLRVSSRASGDYSCHHSANRKIRHYRNLEVRSHPSSAETSAKKGFFWNRSERSYLYGVPFTHSVLVYAFPAAAVMPLPAPFPSLPSSSFLPPSVFGSFLQADVWQKNARVCPTANCRSVQAELAHGS